MGRRLLVRLGVLAALAAAGLAAAWALGARPAEAIGGLVRGSRPPILVGLLHSQTGPLAIGEKSLVDAEELALEEINARGGIGGRRVEARVADGRSDPLAFASEARRLIESEGVSVIFGCPAAECRKATRAVVEERRGLLVTPGSYEGMEQSPRFVYAGGSANQTVMPAVRWAVDALKARRFFVAGTEEAWSRTVAEIAKDAIKAAGAGLAGESYHPAGGSDAGPLASAIAGARPDVVLSSIVGDSNAGFYASLRAAGLSPEKLPVISFTVSEDELRRISKGDVAGHYSVWSYFQGVDREENRRFVRQFRAKYGESRVTSDPIVAAYGGVILWAQAAEEAGSGDPEAVLEHLGRQSLDAPEGIVTIDPESRAIWRPMRVGRARPDGQFDPAWSLESPIQPLTFTTTRTRPQWLAFQEGLRARWGGRWSSAGPATAPPPPK